MTAVLSTLLKKRTPAAPRTVIYEVKLERFDT